MAAQSRESFRAVCNPSRLKGKEYYAILNENPSAWGKLNMMSRGRKERQPRLNNSWITYWNALVQRLDMWESSEIIMKSWSMKKSQLGITCMSMCQNALCGKSLMQNMKLHIIVAWAKMQLGLFRLGPYMQKGNDTIATQGSQAGVKDLR